MVISLHKICQIQMRNVHVKTKMAPIAQTSNAAELRLMRVLLTLIPFPDNTFVMLALDVKV